MSRWKKTVEDAFSKISLVARFLCLLHVSNTYLFSPTNVYGPSMLPTLNVRGDVVVAEHVSHRVGKVGRGDVVLVRSPLNPTMIVTKRILGMEGDSVSFFSNSNATHPLSTLKVPKGHVWIQGDNVSASRDSRHFGPVPYALIQGKVFLRVWPLDGFGFLRE